MGTNTGPMVSGTDVRCGGWTGGSYVGHFSRPNTNEAGDGPGNISPYKSKDPFKWLICRATNNTQVRTSAPSRRSTLPLPRANGTVCLMGTSPLAAVNGGRTRAGTTCAATEAETDGAAHGIIDAMGSMSTAAAEAPTGSKQERSPDLPP